MKLDFHAIPVSLLWALLYGSALAAPGPAPRQLHSGGLHVPLTRRAAIQRNDTEWGLWAKQQKDMLEGKYSNTSTLKKRTSGYNLITNQNSDSSYFGSLAVGTPPVAYEIILDTGSSDLWLAGTACASGCGNVPLLDSSSSSSYKNLSQSFSITYGSGHASGALAQDVVQMAGFEVNNQIFGVCDVVSSGLLSSPVSGLLGLGWQALASSGATPFWQTLFETNVWDEPLMAFQPTRYVNASNTQSLEPGGTFTMGNVNSSLYSGNIDYQTIPADRVAYWTLTLAGVSVNGNALSLITPNALAAIDTGTTLVGGPSNEIANLYAQIPNSAPGNGNYEGYYTYPCDTEINVSLSFGSGPAWSISPADFMLSKLSSGQCLGAFFVFTGGSSAPAWIVGDTFLKNVYAVFRANPPSVGFAALSDAALALNGEDGAAPSPTIGSVSASVTGSGRSHSNSASVLGRKGSRGVALGAMIGAVVLICL